MKFIGKLKAHKLGTLPEDIKAVMESLKLIKRPHMFSCNYVQGGLMLLTMQKTEVLESTIQNKELISFQY